MRDAEALISQMLENAYQIGLTARRETILTRTWTRRDTLTTAALFLIPLLIVALTFLARM